ncbi:hypothetical protein [Streptomyces scabiei]|uniref:hypothetical protein n=2 Tax=Streptomyces TaxID=1883 RepID=UPI0015C4EFC6|nr:hypothetical protein [Streptomyces scabiei]
MKGRPAHPARRRGAATLCPIEIDSLRSKGPHVRMRPLVTLVSAVAAVALMSVLASPAAANPPLPLPELGTLVGEGIGVEGPLIQNVSLLK